MVSVVEKLRLMSVVSVLEITLYVLAVQIQQQTTMIPMRLYHAMTVVNIPVMMVLLLLMKSTTIQV